MANIGGTLLAGIYAAWTLAAVIFISLPITPLSVILFSVVIGGAPARYRAAHDGSRRASLRLALHGPSLRAGVRLAPARQPHGRLARRTALGLYDDYYAGLVDLRRCGFLSLLVHLPIREHRAAMAMPT